MATKMELTAELIDDVHEAARQAEGRCGVLITADAFGRMVPAPSIRVPRRQIWTSWGTKVRMAPDWPRRP
jgi:hypothetical protein